jgi:hypothetical protein
MWTAPVAVLEKLSAGRPSRMSRPQPDRRMGMTGLARLASIKADPRSACLGCDGGQWSEWVVGSCRSVIASAGWAYWIRLIRRVKAGRVEALGFDVGGRYPVGRCRAYPFRCWFRCGRRPGSRHYG